MRISAIAALVLGFADLLPPRRTALHGTTKERPVRWSGASSTRRTRPARKGHEQSPLDIRGAHLNKALKPLEFHYIAGPVTLENTGNGIVAHVDRGSFMVAGGVRYQLVEIDFHHPSEHPVKGKLSDMEADLVHRSEDGKLAIVAVRLNQDRGFPERHAGHAVGAPAHEAGRHGKGDRYGERGRPAARRPRLLDLHGLRGDAALHRGGAVVCLRGSPEHKPGAVSRLREPLQDEHAPGAGRARAAD